MAQEEQVSAYFTKLIHSSFPNNY